MSPLWKWLIEFYAVLGVTGAVSLWDEATYRSLCLTIPVSLDWMAFHLRSNPLLRPGLGILRTSVPTKRRGRDDEVKTITALFLDVDLIHPCHQTSALPRTINGALWAFVEIGLPPPSCIVVTGGGVHLYLLLTRTLEPGPGKRLIVGVHRFVARAWSDRGWVMNHATALNQLVRSPGSLWIKAGFAPVACTLLTPTPDLTAPWPRYEPEVLAAIVGVDLWSEPEANAREVGAGTREFGAGGGICRGEEEKGKHGYGNADSGAPDHEAADRMRWAATRQASHKGVIRNEVALQLACQLRDCRLSEQQAWGHLEQWRLDTNANRPDAEPFTEERARGVLRRAFTRSPRPRPLRRCP